jgi:xanthine dehydrogenase molybdopterin-binding subunit B
MKKILISVLATLFVCSASYAKKNAKEVTYNESGEIIKTGINLGPLPVVAFDADRGFQFGALLNLYNFGNGDTYPNPKSQWYI